MKQRKTATLILDDGSRYTGYAFGYEAAISGEVVFNTAMTGYTESLTDPSYRGQILVMTYPLVGNYGVPTNDVDGYGIELYMESDRIHPLGLIVSDYSEEYSHWNGQETLSDWLIREKVFGLTGIDTRELAKSLREKGSMKGKIVLEGEADIPFEDHSLRNLVAEVSPKEVKVYGNGPKKVVLVDCGAKNNIVRQLIRPEITLYRVPWDYDFNQIDYDGLFLSNGPGDPNMCAKTVEHIRKAIERGKPICGICMGNQLLATAAGATVSKMKYGHRSHNQPVREVGTPRCFITSQNHGYAVDISTLAEGWQEKYINLNDGTNEGICHKTLPYFSAQFHPEACSGPTDTMFIFDEFLSKL
ncbi:MAG: glutamine-hydrolyzing carbamoyl-phosphate synthase small subunit [Porphyromonadaceae bacterium]|nr:glutamine-hydrolyzing carbamoyl-phosphate synthase small subunit [Porphyromonadaceae bacterium]